MGAVSSKNCEGRRASLTRSGARYAHLLSHILPFKMLFTQKFPGGNAYYSSEGGAHKFVRTCYQWLLKKAWYRQILRSVDEHVVYPDQVRNKPSWSRSWANSSLLELFSHRNAAASLGLLGQPNTFRSSTSTSRRAPARRCGRMTFGASLAAGRVCHQVPIPLHALKDTYVIHSCD